MSATELYTKDAKVWIPDSELVWKAASLLEDYVKPGPLRIVYDDGEESTITVKSKETLPPLKNPDILIGENDLTALSYLHEPAVLYNLQVRFCDRNAIYTYCGIVLVAINPYQQLPIYDQDTIHAYSGMDMAQLDPHIFAVAEEAFKRMSRFEENQSIIVSGESGAGKTVSAKYAMRYFATVGGAQAETQVEKKVLSSNPIMEAIGNAKTTRNDNSSRFGKYIEIGFSKQHHIVGANMRTYLLEKSRVVFQAPQERNYHIFYQLCAHADDPEFAALKLNHPDVFLFTNQGEDPYIDGVFDEEELDHTREALTTLGINHLRQMEIFRVLSGILHMGNVLITDDENRHEASVVMPADKHLPLMCELFAIDEEQLRLWLCQRKIVTANELVMKPLSVAEALFARDALAKHIYSQLFNYIVGEVNKALVTAAKKNKFIGVLDIYGFETFEINSFEQFCINYANEKLQQQFCLHVFKLEQEEYVKEAIEWAFIDFYDNQPCISLIEGKLGILDLLDEECRMPRGSEENWCQKLNDKHAGKHRDFEKPRMGRKSFIIHHFADHVEYRCDGFLEKNRDTIMEEQVNIFKAGDFEFVAELFKLELDAPSAEPAVTRMKSGVLRAAKQQPQVDDRMISSSEGGSKSHRKTVGSQFRDSLSRLMDTLFSTTPHYVRCIKPNDYKMPFTFEPKRAVQQLRACGVLETIRISAAGYPSRWTYAEFFQRYRVLGKFKDINRRDLKKTCSTILSKLIEDRDKYQFGKTKIFFRAGQVAYLEKLRSDKLRACGIMIQKHVKGFLARRRYKKIRKSVTLVQRYGRGCLARRHATHLRRTAAATKIQAMWRCFRWRRKFLGFRRCIIAIQSFARATFGRIQYNRIRLNAKVIIIQKTVRMWLARKKYQKFLWAVVKLQGRVRMRAAKRELKQLRIEARSVEHVKKQAKGLENKIIELQQKLEDKKKEVTVMKEENTHLVDVKNEFDKLKHLKEEKKVLDVKLTDMESIIEALKAELKQEKEEKQNIINENAKKNKEKEEVILNLRNEESKMKVEIKERDDLIEKLREQQQGQISEHLADERTKMELEREGERAHHQKLVKEHERLQQRILNMQGELQLSSMGHKRTGSELSSVSLETDAAGSDVTDKVDDAASEDLGYGTDRRKQKSKDGAAVELKPADVALITRLQARVREQERMRSALQAELERREAFAKARREAPQSHYGMVAQHEDEDYYNAIKVQELEMENAQLKDEIFRMRGHVAANGVIDSDKDAGKEFMDQFNAMSDELNRRREECIQLRTLMAHQNSGFAQAAQVARENYGGVADLVNEDGELEMAYKTQKDLNKMLEIELQNLQDSTKEREKELNGHISELRKENATQQKLITQNLTLTPEAKIEATMQHEITRLTSENLDLRESIDKQLEQVKKLKKALKVYARRLKTGDASDVAAELERELAEEAMPSVRQRETRQYVGMLEYHRDDEQPLIRCLIAELKPRLAAAALPGLPAYILFMCIRHTDYLNDDEKVGLYLASAGFYLSVQVRSLLTNTINGIKRVVKKKQDDLETITLWLSNTCRLIHNLKQYSGEKTFQSDNTPKQNEHCLRNFDLSEYRQILNDLAVWIYQGLIKLMESQIHPMIVSAILEHEAIAGLSSGKPTGLRGRSQSRSDLDDPRSPTRPDFSLDSLIKSLNNFMRVLSSHAVDPELVKQIFRQLLYFVCANGLNNLLLRKDMCHWSKGMQIRYNCSHLEQWLRDNKLQDTGCGSALEPLVQASQLLQARKTESDVDSICDMCSRLTTSQIIKILNLYTPVNEFEERVPISFIRRIQEKLQTRHDSSQTLLMDTKFFYAVTFPFSPSTLGLETIQVPLEWGLTFLKRM